VPDQPTDQIPRAEVTALLAAIVDALDVGQAARAEDDAKAHRLLMSRVAHVSGALQYVVHNASARPAAATLAIGNTADYYPVTYEPYAPTLGDEDTPWPDERAESLAELEAAKADSGATA
jgi:hypothetical protein